MCVNRSTIHYTLLHTIQEYEGQTFNRSNLSLVYMRSLKAGTKDSTSKALLSVTMSFRSLSSMTLVRIIVMLIMMKTHHTWKNAKCKFVLLTCPTAHCHSWHSGPGRLRRNWSQRTSRWTKEELLLLKPLRKKTIKRLMRHGKSGNISLSTNPMLYKSGCGIPWPHCRETHTHNSGPDCLHLLKVDCRLSLFHVNCCSLLEHL